MDFNAADITHYSCQFANELLYQKLKKDIQTVSEDTLNEENVLTGKYGTSIVNNLILGALLEYHNQLRQCLITKQGIDIGAFDIEN